MHVCAISWCRGRRRLWLRQCEKRRAGHTRRCLGAVLCLLLGLGWAYAPASAREYYVDTNHRGGSDRNPGTATLPFKTISAAAQVASPGDTVWVAAGTYRESVDIRRSGRDQAMISFRALPGHEVHVQGSDLVSGWVVHARGIWKRPDWQVNSQQVFVDGSLLQQVGINSPFHSQRYMGKPILPPRGHDLSDLFPGSFWYDQRGKALYVWLADGSDPNKHTVEASVRDTIFVPKRDLHFIEIRDLHLSHTNATAQGARIGMLSIFGNGWVVAGNTLTYGDFSGLHVTGLRHQIQNNTINYNGFVGININCEDNVRRGRAGSQGVSEPPSSLPADIQVDGNVTNYNNYRHSNVNWHAGGMKVIPTCDVVTVTRHTAVANDGPGIWFDGGCTNVLIDRSVVADNADAGIFYEISGYARITNNLVTGNKRQGIFVAAAHDVTVANNTVFQNWVGIVVHGMPRQEHPTLQSNTVLNNIISESTLADLVVYMGPGAMHNTSDYNLYFRHDGTVRIAWTPRWGYDVNYLSLAGFTLATGQEAHSRTGNPKWVDVHTHNFRLQDGSPAIDQGKSDAGSKQRQDQKVRPHDFDLDGKPRIVDGNGDGEATIDLGAYEFQPQSAHPTQSRISPAR